MKKLFAGLTLAMLFVVVSGAGAAFGADSLTIRRVDTTKLPRP